MRHDGRPQFQYVHISKHLLPCSDITRTLNKFKDKLTYSACRHVSPEWWNIPFRGVIPSSGSCQVELANPGTALNLDRTCWHDRDYTTKGKMALFASKCCQEPFQQPGYGIRMVLLSENGRRIAFWIMPSSVNRKAAVYPPQKMLRNHYLR
jgi:hypothetical protein